MNLNDIKRALSPSEASLSSLPAHVKAFCAFMIGDEHYRLIDALKFGAILQEQERTYEIVASIGYALAAQSEFGALGKTFLEDVARLGGRKFFNKGRALRFEIDGIALLGVAIGLAAAKVDATDAKWLVALLAQCESAVRGDEWQLSLVRAAKEVLTDKKWANIPSNSLRVAVPYSLSLETSLDDRQKAWSEASLIVPGEELSKICAKRAVFDCCASALAAMPINGATVDELVRILEGIDRSMRRWTFETKPQTRGGIARQWHIDHEFHVQNLLWVVLAPIFPDLLDEEYLPSVGHRTPRYDIGIPSLRTIVEVKFLRTMGAPACSRLTEEIAADVALYLRSNQGYDKIIPFIWDDCCQSEEYSKLRTGLESLDGVIKTIIQPRPSRMSRTN